MTFEEHEAAWRKAFLAAGHTFIMTVPDEGDEEHDPPRPNMWVVDHGFHNGPGCATCGWSCCMHCQKAELIPKCKGTTP